ncbi:MAG TPA: hypothetical protein VMW75_26845 [Thermoanaerobaculia bacterium]|nr:hypothetical protein [Thermoanaerobaculia bacterium]
MAQLIDPFRRSLHGHLHRPGAGVPVPAAVIASTSTPVPRGAGNFTFMTFPQVSPEIAVFVGSGKDQPSNVYASLGGSLQVFLAVGAGIPSTGGKFTDFGLPTPAGQAAAFVGAGSEDTLGVYVKSGEIMQRVADTRMAVPGGAGTFSAFGQPGFDAGGTIAFVGRDGSGAYGVYAAGFPVRQAPVVIANGSTPIPGGGGTFSYLDGAVATAAGITFFGNHEGQQVAAGIYTSRGGSLNVVADHRTVVPGVGGTFTGFASPAASGDRVAFHGVGSAGSDGIYVRAAGGPLQVVADRNTPVPGGHGVFQTFFTESPAIAGDGVAFLGGYENNKFGIFARVGGSLKKLVTTDDTIDGRGIIYLGITVNQLAGGRLAFYAVTGSGIFGNYTLPAG